MWNDRPIVWLIRVVVQMNFYPNLHRFSFIRVNNNDGEYSRTLVVIFYICVVQIDVLIGVLIEPDNSRMTCLI